MERTKRSTQIGLDRTCLEVRMTHLVARPARWLTSSRMRWIGAAALIAAIAATIHAAGGSLDPTFGGTGLVTTDFYGEDDFAQALVRQDDGKLVVAGFTFGIPGGFGLARYNPDGLLDTSFGIGGLATAAFDGFPGANALVLLGDGKLVAAGYALNQAANNSYDFALARFNTDGSLDGTFGSDGTGTVFRRFGAGFNLFFGLARQQDGKLIAVGQVHNGRDTDFAVLRYNADGTPDLSFGTAGIVITDFGSNETARAIVQQADDKLVVAGFGNFVVPGQRDDFLLARYNPNGSLDQSFGSGGKVITDFSGGLDRAYALLLQPDGKLVAAGGEAAFKLARYNQDGSLDASFGAGGEVTTDLGHLGFDQANSLVRQPDGKLVAAGAVSSDGTEYDLALVRYNDDGSPDVTFGTGGAALITLSGDFASGSGAGLVLQPDGKLVATAHTLDAAGMRKDFALARYDPGPSIDLPILTVHKAGTGAGTVTSNPAAIDCGPNCIASFAFDETVSLMPVANAGSTFAGWTGDCSAAGAVTMTADKSCTATFTRIVHTLTVTKAGAGSGTVTSMPQGIDCGVTCMFSFPEGNVVTLTAAVSQGSTFSGWGGDCSVPGTVTMNTNKTCVATFAALGTSTISLTSSKPTSTLGQTVTFTATVIGTAPRGQVRFEIDSVRVFFSNLQAKAGSATESTATIQIGTLAPGSHQVKAIYAGDGNNPLPPPPATTQQTVDATKASGSAVRAILDGFAGAVRVTPDRLDGHFGLDSQAIANDSAHTAVGNSFALGALHTDGPHVHASSLAGSTGFGFGTSGARAIGYMTVPNPFDTATVPQYFNAQLTGSINIPGGHATAAVYVYDADEFLRQVESSGQSLEQFLLGPDTLARYGAGDEATLSLVHRLPTGLKGINFLPPILGPRSKGSPPIPLTVPAVLIDPYKAVIVIFDLSVYAPPGANVDFASTLKPAPVFITDADGNPSSLTVVGPASPEPPAPTALTLTPASTTASLTTPVTVTATATAGGAPVPNTLVFFTIGSGPNAQPAVPAVTDATGTASFKYAGGSVVGTDQIQANIGAVTSNAAAVTWTAGPLDHIAISPSTATIAAGGSQPFTTQALDALGNNRGDVTAGTTFTIAPNGSCTGATCTATIGGPHTVTATYNGKAAAATLNVTSSAAYTFQGFFQPIDMSSLGAIVWNTVKGGQTVPVKWRLTRDGVPVADPASFLGLSAPAIPCPGAGSIEDAIEQSATRGSGLQYNDDGNWQFNWQTAASDRGTCRALAVRFNDGTTSPVAYFKFK